MFDIVKRETLEALIYLKIESTSEKKLNISKQSQTYRNKNKYMQNKNNNLLLTKKSIDPMTLYEYHSPCTKLQFSTCKI